MRTTALRAVAAAALSVAAGCQGPESVVENPPEVTAALALPAAPYAYADADVALPAYLRSDFVKAQDNTPADNPITDAGAALGRVLFYDTALSLSGTVSCASCHSQAHAFSDTTATSLGFAGERTARNAMPIVDARFYRDGRFFWDERAATLEAQVLQPIQNPVEMGLTLPQLVERVGAKAYYPFLFTQAFGDATVTSDRIARALAQFSRAIVSYRARFDEGLAATGNVQAGFPNFTAEENRGKQLFLGPAGCAACHLDEGRPPGGARQNQAVFYIAAPVNNGLTAGGPSDDAGVGAITGRRQDMGRFKAPSLRNVALTAPYMHDGSLATLADVIDHYDKGVLAHPNLDPRLQEPTRPAGTVVPRRLNLTAADRAALAAFLGTLTDQALLTDPKFADPFRR